jgi:hypothetical protein
MPRALAEVRNHKLSYDAFGVEAAEVAQRIPKAVLREVGEDPERRDLASFDINMLVAATFHADSSEALSEEAKKVPDGIKRIALQFAETTGKIPIPSYEDLVMINPLAEDPRTFSAAPISTSERDFYLTHLLIEHRYTEAVDLLVDSIERLNTHGRNAIDIVVRNLTSVAKNIEVTTSISKHMRQEMQRGSFSSFRDYFMPIVIDGNRYTGASGRYTAGLPIIESLLADPHFSPFFSDDVKKFRTHFPRAGMAMLDATESRRAEGLSLGGLIHALGHPSELRSPTDQVTQEISKFRRVHMSLVKRFVPEALSGGEGTGGADDVRKFLTDRFPSQHITW